MAALSLPSLTVIVATTPSMGIGRAGSLPWPALKVEMAYFAQVTKRPPALPALPRAATSHSTAHDNPSSAASATTTGPQKRPRNAVIMGRKTWDSIPARFRPLPGRVNVVITRRALSATQPLTQTRNQTPTDDNDVLVASSLDDGLTKLGSRGPLLPPLGRVFVIGGAEIYKAALLRREPAVDRILWTRIRKEFECDTFFPMDLSRLADDDGGGGMDEWVSKSLAELRAWTGQEDLLDAVQREGEVEYEFRMLEKRQIQEREDTV